MDKLDSTKKRVLLLVAHPDDEIIFCAGTMLAHPKCQWMIVSATDDGRPKAFANSIEHLKRLGVNIVFHTTLGLKNVPVDAHLSDLVAEKAEWKKGILDAGLVELSADVVITHNEHGEYGHGAHKLLSAIADELFESVWKFVYPELAQTSGSKKIKVTLGKKMLSQKKELFVENYPSEQYIWKALRPVMIQQFEKGVEQFSLNRFEQKRMFAKVDAQSKKRILVILPDRFTKSVGGIGANSGPIFEMLSNEYDFYVSAYPLAGTPLPSFVKEYHEVVSPFTEVKSGVVNTLVSQASYLAASISFPKPDLVFAFDWSIYLAAVETARHFNVPLIARMSMSPILLAEEGYAFGLNLKNPIEKALHNAFCEMEIRGLKKADRIIHVSHAYLECYKKIAPNFTKRSRIVIDGIDMDMWRSVKVGNFILPGKNRKKIVFLGRFSEVKGIVPLCEAKVPKDIDLIFIGPKETADRICLSKIEEKVAREKNVYYIGALYGEDKIRALKSADALIIPSYLESFGGVGLEGLAAGCIVISSRAGGLSDFLNDKTSIFCGTTAAHIEKAYQLFLDQTEAGRTKMRDTGFKVCGELTIASAARELDSVFRELIS